MSFIRRHGRRGIALLEVLLATAVFCIVGLAMIKGMSRLIASVRLCNRKNQVRIGLESQLAEARVQPVRIGVQKEPPDPSGVVYEREWKALSLLGQDRQALPDLYLLTVRARWTDRDEHTQQASLRLYLPSS